MIAKFKEFVKVYHSELVWGGIIISVTIISFNLGRMSVGNSVAKLPITISSPANAQSITASGTTAPQAPKDPTVVASKASSSHLYHFTWCSGAKRISEKNK